MTTLNATHAVTRSQYHEGTSLKVMAAKHRLGKCADGAFAFCARHVDCRQPLQVDADALHEPTRHENSVATPTT